MSGVEVEMRVKPVDKNELDAGTVAEVRDLRVDFERDGSVVHALRGVNLTLRRGEVVALVGESGSGKSVLSTSLLGLLPSNLKSATGTAAVEGVDMLSASERDRRRVRRVSLGAVFQDPMSSLNPTQRIGRQLDEVTKSRPESARLLEAVGIPDADRCLSSYPHELSGGMRQRVMIALAAAGDVKLLVADEPTTALDVTVQAQILELFKNMCRELGLTILFVTHDLGVASVLADRIAVMYGGRIAEIGRAVDVLERPSHPYTAALRQSKLTLDWDRSHELVALPGEPPDPTAVIDACPFGPRCDFHTSDCDLGLPALARIAGRPTETACTRADQIPLDAVIHRKGPEWAPLPLVAEAPAVVEIADGQLTFTTGTRGQHAVIRAMDHVDLRIEQNEAVSIVGLSGCGKSTLLRVLAGLIPLDAGVVKWGGERSAQMVFQDAGSSLTPWMTIGELVGERLRGMGKGKAEREEDVARALSRVGLSPALAAARPSQLSGGQKQRAAIARAIVVPPTLLLCDEPTSALDVSFAAVVLNLLGELRRELQMSMVFVTHDLGAARLVGDRILVMESGRIVEGGPTDEVLEDPQHPLTRTLLASVPGGPTHGSGAPDS